MLVISEELKQAYPGGYIGILVLSGVINPESSPGLDRQKEYLEDALRVKFKSFDRAGLALTEPLNTYIGYYRRFKKTYHVLLQLESIVFKNKSIPKVAALVEIMFMAELKNMLLTAGHDMERLDLPLRADLTGGNQHYTTLSGLDKEVLPDDMLIADKQGIISSIIYGPDERTRITRNTERVVFTVYAPPGVSQSLIFNHLQDIHYYALLVSPLAKIDLKEVYTI